MLKLNMYMLILDPLTLVHKTTIYQQHIFCSTLTQKQYPIHIWLVTVKVA